MTAWTPEFCAFLAEVTPEQVLQPARGDHWGATRQSREELHLVQTAQRLSWHYGDARAAAIMGGEDVTSRADLAAWDRLGRRAAV